MESNLYTEESSFKRSSIYLKIRRSTLDHRTLIPMNLKISRRSTMHNRIEKPFEDAYNNSPRTRMAKMKAARKTPESTSLISRTFALEPSSSICNASRKSGSETKSNLRNKMLLRVLNLCEQERANTHKLIQKISTIEKNLEFDKSTTNQKKELYTMLDKKILASDFQNKKPKEKKRIFASSRLKENYILPN